MSSRFCGLYVLIFLQILLPSIQYFMFTRGGDVISKHNFRKMAYWEVIFSVIVIASIFYYEFFILNDGVRGTMITIIYLVIANSILNQDILVTTKGYFYIGKYTKWNNVVSINKNKKEQLMFEKVTMIITEHKINDIVDEEVFLDIARLHMEDKI